MKVKQLLKASGEVYAEIHPDGPVEWEPRGSFGGERFVAARAEPVSAALQPGALYNPLAPPVVGADETSITVDYALQNPSRVITPMIIDITLQRFFVDRVFANGGGVTGGAVIYNEVAGNDLYAERDVQEVAPGEEFPVLTFQRRGFKIATPRKWGAKFPITWEARDRNDVNQFTNAVRQMSNTIVRKINQMGVTLLDAYVAANSRQVTGHNWQTVVTVGSSASNWTLWPANDFAKAELIAEQEELGIEYSVWIMNPQEYTALAGIYGDSLDAMLAAHNVDIYVTNRVAAGTAYVVAPGQVGEMRLEAPLRTRTWDDPDGIEQTWTQSSVRPLMFANNPFAVLKFVGLAG
jgi:hypothetical protein